MKFTSIWQNVSISTAGAALLTLGTVAPGAAVSLYSITDLSSVASGPVAINDLGQLVGITSINDEGECCRVFLWENGVINVLGTLGGNSIVTWGGLNNSGVVVGGAYTDIVDYSGYPIFHAFLWSESQGMIDLTPSDRFSITRAEDINDAGQVIITTQNHTAFLWENGVRTNICLNPSGRCDVHKINNNGQVVGSIEVGLSNERRHAFRWENGQITDLNTPGDSTIWSSANAINDFGQIAGEIDLHAAFWQNDTQIIDLGTLGGRRSNALDINNQGLVAGWSETASGREIHPFLWDSTNGMQDLNNLIPANSGWVLTGGARINDAGQIIASGIFNGEPRSVLLTPEAEPIPERTSALGVLGLGAIAVGFRLLRYSKKY